MSAPRAAIRGALIAAAAAVGAALLIPLAAAPDAKPAATTPPAASKTESSKTAPLTRLRFADATPGSGIVFRDVCGAPPEKKVWLTESLGAGAAFLDAENDGTLDLFLVNGSSHDRPAGSGEPCRYFRGLGGGRFADRTDEARLGSKGWGYGVAAGDIDNDGDTDLFVTRLGQDTLLRNDGAGKFTDVTAASGIRESAWGTSAAFFDADGDGDLDLYVANYVDFDPTRVPRLGAPEADRRTCSFRGIKVFCGPLGLPAAQSVLWRNDGAGRFEDATRAAGLWLPAPRYGLGAVTGDLDNDGDTDLYVANDSLPNSLWRNRGDGTYEEAAVPLLAAFSGDGGAQAGMGVDAGDYDGDGWLDLVVTNFSHDLNTIYRNEAGKFFSDVSSQVGLQATWFALSWGVGFEDFDNDGDLDLFIANGHIYPQMDGYDFGTRYRQRNHLFENLGGRFVEVSEGAGGGLAPVRSWRGAAFADYDNDGDVDILATAIDDAPVLIRNDTTPRGHWLSVRLVGAARSNRDAVGARVTLFAGGRTQIRERKGGGSFLSASEGRLHFGLGDATTVSSLTVRWPDGRSETLRDLSADRELTIRQGASATLSSPPPAAAKTAPGPARAPTGSPRS